MMAELTNVIRVFISSKQREFVEERQGMTEIVRRLPLLAADAAEEWAPGRDSIEATFLSVATMRQPLGTRANRKHCVPRPFCAS